LIFDFVARHNLFIAVTSTSNWIASRFAAPGPGLPLTWCSHSTENKAILLSVDSSNLVLRTILTGPKISKIDQELRAQRGFEVRAPKNWPSELKMTALCMIVLIKGIHP
jgi:hypothetical protein